MRRPIALTIVVTATIAVVLPLGAQVGCSQDDWKSQPTTTDTTLEAYSQDGELDVWMDPSGRLQASVDPWPSLAGYESATPCPRLHVSATVNGSDVTWADMGSGRPIGNGPLPLYACSLPQFVAQVAAGAPIDVRVWDESRTWHFAGSLVAPKGALVGTDALHIGAWSHVSLDPVPQFMARARFYADDAGTLFSFESRSDGSACSTDFVVHANDGGVDTDAGVSCPITFAQDGIVVFVPDVGNHTGDLAVDGFPISQTTACDGVGACNLRLLGPSSSEPTANVRTEILP
jgi:hypothetical protein